MTKFTNINSLMLEGVIGDVYNDFSFRLDVKPPHKLEDPFTIEVNHGSKIKVKEGASTRIIGHLAIGNLAHFIVADHVEQLNR